MSRRRIIDPDESDEEEVITTRANNQEQRNQRATRASRRRPTVVNEEDGESCSSQQLEHSHDESDEQVEEQIDEIATEESAGSNHPTVGEAVLAALALSAKGPIKEPDLKPLLNRGRFKDWQDGLNELNAAISNAFGINLVYDGPSHQFFMKNDLAQIRGEINELYTNGTLEGVRVDDGSAARRPIPDDDEFTEDDKKGLLFTLLASIMMSSNAELGHKMWLVDEDSLRQMCKTMKVPDEIFKKTLSGHNAEFIRSGWIRKIEEKNANQDVSARYTWGPRAVTTLSTSAVFEKYLIVNKQTQFDWGNCKEIFQKLDEKNGLYNKR